MSPNVGMPPDLIRAFAEGQAVLLLGSGYSASLGLPSTQTLCTELAAAVRKDAERLGPGADSVVAALEDAHPADLARISALYDRCHSPNASRLYIAERLLVASEQLKLSQATCLADTHIGRIITTNYDTVVERVFDHRVNVWYDDAHIVHQFRQRPRLVKLHGTATDADSMILRRDDYDQFHDSRPSLIKIVAADILQYYLVIVGYSLEDDNVRQLIKSTYRKAPSKKEFTLVVRDADAIDHSLWQDLNVRIIQADAQVFISNMVAAVGEYYRTTAPDYGAVERERLASDPDEDHNPFRYFQADKITYGQMEIVRRYFVPVPEQAAIVSPGSNTIIGGSRGSGKTMLLRYLSVEVTLNGESDESSAFVGFYVKCAAKLFTSYSCRGDGTCDNREWVDYFVHIFVLTLLLRVCEILALVSKRALIDIPPAAERAFSQYIVERLVRCEWIDEESQEFQSAAESIQHLLNTQRSSQPRDVHYKLPADSLSQAVDQLERLHPMFSGRPVFFLLDEMENLTTAQWSVVNLFLRDRDDRVTFKVASSVAAPLRDANGRVLRPIDDYTYVSTDRYSKAQKPEFVAFLRKVANKCLEEGQAGIGDVDELLERRVAVDLDDRLRLLGKDYSGFDGYANLASGVVRAFVSLLKDTVARAEPEVLRRSVALTKIPHTVQRDVVLIKSTIHREACYETKHSENVRQLINGLGALFRDELQRSVERARKSTESEYNRDAIRTVSQVEVRNASRLSPEVREAVEEAVDAGLLQRPLRDRQPDHRATQIPHENVRFHRLLCPYYSLALANRHPRTIDASILNQVLDLGDREFVALVNKGGERAPASDETQMGLKWEGLEEEALGGDLEDDAEQ